MADQHQLVGHKTLSTSVLGLITVGPLLILMGLTFLGSATLLLICSPLLLLVSPLLLLAGLVIFSTVSGFVASFSVASAGVATLSYALRAARRDGPVAVPRVAETLTESGQRVREEKMEVGRYLEEKVEVHPREDVVR